MKKVTLELNEQELEQLIETFFAGSFILEEEYNNPFANMKLASKINKLALEFGRNDLVISDAELIKDNLYPIGQKVDNTSGTFGKLGANPNFENKIRKELGPSFGIRLSYTGISVNPKIRNSLTLTLKNEQYIPLNKDALNQMKSGKVPPVGAPYFIKYAAKGAGNIKP